VTAEGLPTALATTISTTVSAHSTTATLTMDEPKAALIPGKAGRLMSKEDQEKIKAAIAKATTIEEVRKMERSLREGYLPEMESVGA
jgi:U2 small nuclear ribonucleoprotein A'